MGCSIMLYKVVALFLFQACSISTVHQYNLFLSEALVGWFAFVPGLALLTAMRWFFYELANTSSIVPASVSLLVSVKIYFSVVSKVLCWQNKLACVSVNLHTILFSR